MEIFETGLDTSVRRPLQVQKRGVVGSLGMTAGWVLTFLSRLGWQPRTVPMKTGSNERGARIKREASRLNCMPAQRAKPQIGNPMRNQGQFLSMF